MSQQRGKESSGAGQATARSGSSQVSVDPQFQLKIKQFHGIVGQIENKLQNAGHLAAPANPETGSGSQGGTALEMLEELYERVSNLSNRIE